MPLFPVGYGTEMVTFDQLVARFRPRAHPEFDRRLFAWIESEQGSMGIGEGWRKRNPTGGTFAPPGQSFHESQQFASRLYVYSAVDLVHVRPGKVHRAPTWAEVESAKRYGLHAFIREPEEPWHLQCIEMRGYSDWIRAGRPDPRRIPLPNDPKPPPEPEPEPPPVTRPKGARSMFIFVVTNAPDSPHPETWLLCDGTQLSHIVDGHAADVFKAMCEIVRSSSVEQTAGIIKSCMTMGDCPPEWIATGWEALWNDSH